MSYTTYVTDIVLADIIGFSKLSTERQFLVACAITGSLRKLLGILSAGTLQKESELVVGFVSTGDGFYVILHPAVSGYGIFLALSLRSSLLLENRNLGDLYEGVRIGAHFGEAAPFEDVCGKANFVGDGMNTCARLLGAKVTESPTIGIPIDENYVAVSAAAYEQFLQLFPQCPQMREFLSAISFAKSEPFRITDKHADEHQAMFVECNRLVAVNPPRPADIDERIRSIGRTSRST